MSFTHYRAVSLWLHRWIGVFLAGFLVMSGLTGSVIAFNLPLDAWLNPEIFDAAAGPVLSLDALEQRFYAQEPQAQIDYLEFGVAPGRAVRAWVAPRPGQTLNFDEVFLDPGDGAILGRRQYGACCVARAKIIPFIYQLHCRLMAGRIGTWIMGLVGLVWFFDCFVALSLTLPRLRPFFSGWSKAWRVKKGARKFRLMFDLHRAGGLWLWITLSTLAFSGFALNLDQPVLRPVLGLFLAFSPDPLLAKPRAAALQTDTPGPDALVAAAARAVRPGWSGAPESLFCPPAGLVCAVYFFTSPAARGLGFGSPVVYLDRRSAVVRQVVGPRAGTTGDLIERLQFSLHSGQVAGVFGKIVVALTGIATALLAATGVWIFWRKRAARRRGQKSRPVSIANSSHSQ